MSPSSYLPFLPLLVLIANPVHVLLMAAVMRLCGVEPAKIARWVLRRADRRGEERPWTRKSPGFPRDE